MYSNIFLSGHDAALQNTDITTTFQPITATTVAPNPVALDVALPSADDNVNLIRALDAAANVPSVRDEDSGLTVAAAAAAAAPVNQVQFFARSAEQGFGVPYRIERTFFDKDAIKNTYCWQVSGGVRGPLRNY